MKQRGEQTRMLAAHLPRRDTLRVWVSIYGMIGQSMDKERCVLPASADGIT